MENIKKAIKHFECMKSDAVAVLDSGFGTKPNESNTVYKNRKLYTELAINALEKQIPKKLTHLDSVPHYRCPCCNDAVKLFEESPTYQIRYCKWCGQALDWSDTE